MDMYTMNQNFIAEGVVDEFISAIWTERYSAAGDVQLVTAATPEMLTKLKEGTFLGLRGTSEVMRLHTQSIEKNQLTVVGSSLTAFLNERPYWAKNPEYNSSSSSPEQKIGDVTVDNKKVGQAIADVVSAMVINTTPIPTLTGVNLQWESEEIANLTLGEVDVSGNNERVTFPIGPLYDAIVQAASKFGYGIQLYLEYATLDTGYSLKFRVYKGDNRTTPNSNKTGGGTFPFNVTDPVPAVSWGTQTVRLVPDMDSLSDVKEIRSVAFYKNVAYVWYKGVVSVHYEDPANIPTGFDRRVMIVNAQGEPPARQIPTPVGRIRMYGVSSGGSGGGATGGGGSEAGMVRWIGGQNFASTQSADVLAFREQQAKDALANNNYVKSVDGQSSPNNDFKFGVDYGLGDIIELQGLTGTLSKARITEYIRSQDRTGEREYPTISVI